MRFLGKRELLSLWELAARRGLSAARREPSLCDVGHPRVVCREVSWRVRPRPTVAIRAGPAACRPFTEQRPVGPAGLHGRHTSGAGWLMPSAGSGSGEATVSGDRTENPVQRCSPARGTPAHREGPRWGEPTALQGPASPRLTQDLGSSWSPSREANCGKMCFG